MQLIRGKARLHVPDPLRVNLRLQELDFALRRDPAANLLDGAAGSAGLSGALEGEAAPVAADDGGAAPSADPLPAPADAVACDLTSGMDVLVMGNFYTTDRGSGAAQHAANRAGSAPALVCQEALTTAAPS